MKKSTILLGLAAALLCGCGKEEFSYTPETSITIEGGEIIQLGKGVSSYTLKANVKSTCAIMECAAYEADTRTGSAKEEIEGSRVSFAEEDKVQTRTIEVNLSGMTGDRCVQIYTRDNTGTEYVKNALVKVFPALVFTDKAIAETNDVYYGTFFATWYLGRTYPLRIAVKYPESIDISFGRITDEKTGITLPAAVSPDKRSKYSMTGLENARTTTFGKTGLSIKEYDSISVIDDSLVMQFSSSDEKVLIEAGKVYSYTTQEGKKGLMAVHSIRSLSGRDEISVSAKVQI